jgi:hypothetical protein
MKFKLVISLLVLSVCALALMAFTPPPTTLAQEPAPATQSAQTAGEVALDMALMVAITAFLKNTFQITGNPVIAIAFVVGVVLWGEPLLAAAFPAVGVYLDSFLTFIKVWLGAMGSVDFVTGTATKIGIKISAARKTAS